MWLFNCFVCLSLRYFVPILRYFVPVDSGTKANRTYFSAHTKLPLQNFIFGVPSLYKRKKRDHRTLDFLLHIDHTNRSHNKSKRSADIDNYHICITLILTNIFNFPPYKIHCATFLNKRNDFNWCKAFKSFNEFSLLRG